jgi:imidazolonepropionase-like amidohydrolase
MRSLLVLFALVPLALSCARGPRPVPAGTDDAFVLRGGHVVGRGVLDVEVRDGRIAALGEVDRALGVVDVGGRFLAPAFIDSHVHLRFLPVAEELARAGVAAAVDLAAPRSFLDELTDAAERPTVLSAGPMLTAPGGYPTQSWGRDGYGLAVTAPDDARRRVAELADAGARLIKVPFGHGPLLDDDTVAAIVSEAHARGLLVAAHALSDEEAARAGGLGCDILAHTPVEPLREATVARFADRAVISTLRAFGGSETTVDNLRRLREAGARVLYGTDLGNTRDARIDPVELDLLAAAGLDGESILAAGSSTPASLWGLDALGAIDVDKEASLLVLTDDPRDDPSTLSRPEAVFLRGRRLEGR